MLRVSLRFWLDRLVQRSRIPYPIFFGLMALFLYLLGIPLMILTGNLSSFLSEPRWLVVALFGALNGVLIIFVFRGFSDSLTRVKRLIDSGSDDFRTVDDRLSGYLTSRAYWIIVVFWLALNFLESPRAMRWWQLYNEAYVASAYELLETLPCCILGGIFMYMVPIGLTLAYRDLCTRTSFRKDTLVSEWMRPFKGFRRLITVTMFGVAVYAIFPPTIWGSAAQSSAASSWTIFIPYASIAIVLISAVLFPHHYFHELFSSAKTRRLQELQKELSHTSVEADKTLLRRILLLLEKAEVERLKTWLLDMKIVGELVLVALVHVLLVQTLTILIHA